MGIKDNFPAGFNIEDIKKVMARQMDNSTYYFIDKDHFRAVYEPVGKNKKGESNYFSRRKVFLNN